MNRLPSLLSYFTTLDNAKQALQEIGRKGVALGAIAYRSKRGSFQLRSLAWRRARAWTLAGALSGTAATLLAILLTGLPLPLLAAGALLGGLTSWSTGAMINRGRMRSLLERSPEWLGPDEFLLVLIAPRRKLAELMPDLRAFGDPPPPVFMVPSYLEDRRPIHLLPGGPLTPTQLAQHASHLAGEHRVEPLAESGRTLLSSLDFYRKTILKVRADLAAAQRAGQIIYPGGEWVLDNAYLIEGHINEVKRGLSSKFYRELPSIAGEPQDDEPRQVPRVYRLAKELVRHSEAHVTETDINSFLEAYQQGVNLSSGELWAMPLMLRIVLSESISRRAVEVRRRMKEAELAEFWAYRLLIGSRGDPDELFQAMAELSRRFPQPTANFGMYLVGHLHDEDLVLGSVQGWLQRRLREPLDVLSGAEQTRQASLQIYLSNAITSLRNLSRLDWREVFERQSAVEAVLRRDPDGVYAQMDFETRDRYRAAIEQIAKQGGRDEVAVAEEVLLLAMGAMANAAQSSVLRHVGYYLIDSGRETLLSRLRVSERLSRRARNWLRRHHTPVYLSSLTAITLLAAATLARSVSAFGLAPWQAALLAAVSLLPASQLAIQVVNFAVTRILPPWKLPKMSFARRGIGRAYRTLVVVPMLLDSRQTIQEEVERLEIRYFANPDDNLQFGLAGDFADADREQLPEDADLLQYAIAQVESLNRKHGKDRFFLFVREREWAESEGQFIGWERKRGKLEDLNRLIAGAQPRTDRPFVRVGNPQRLQQVRFVITLDSDTMLTSESARRMIETMAHPLNEPQLGTHGRVERGYGIIQPRVSTSLPSATATFFARMFNDPVGTDPYTTAVSDIYQDMAGEASYHGKGIYDPRVFHQVLADRFPPERILSHDLLEGAHVRTGLATDIELYDEFPPNYSTYARREHRWIRGDWQIADWCLPWVPDPTGGRTRNPISMLNRWKVFDNLRRSLVPLGLVAFLTTSWWLAPRLALIASAVTAFLIFFQPFIRLTTWAGRLPGRRNITRLQLGHSLLRSVAEASLLPHQAILTLDAISRVWYRRWISRRRLLEWTTAQTAAWRDSGSQLPFLALVAIGSLLAVVLTVTLTGRSQLAAGPYLVLWFVSPLIAWRLSVRRRRPLLNERISPSDQRMLRRIARKTWRYFDDFVGPDTHWLPPDNYQVSHQDMLAKRTSPTNIGLWMLSALAAHDFGYLTLESLLGRLEATLATLRGLARYEGHFLNWYDLDTLAPLEPRYVSSVDSGNLVASLWALRAGLQQIGRRALLGTRLTEGLRDTVEALLGSLALHDITGDVTAALEAIEQILSDRSASTLLMLHSLQEPAEKLGEHLRGSPRDWALAFVKQISDWIQFCERYGIGNEPAGQELPSLVQLGSGGQQQHRHPAPPGVEQAALALTRLEAIAQEAGSIADQVEFGFLYDSARRIFHIGFNVTEMRLDSSYYDLLASEARLASYVAIAKADVPPEHWLALSRPYGSANGRQVLSSWGGTMFEYLMPHLFQHEFQNSLLSAAMRQAIEVQIRYARKRAVPWGISESAYADLDANKTYQYRAFGVPGLGLKHGLEQDLVVAPYATLLAIEIRPDRALENLKRLKDLGLESDYGYFESIDFSRQRTPLGERGVLVRAYMAHHQAMGFLALANLFFDGAIRHYFHDDPRTRAVEPVLYERIPAAMPFGRVPTERIETELAPLRGVGRAVSRFATPHTRTPVTQLLSNGRYVVLMTGAGGGRSRWNGFEITRWRSDPTRDHWGSFIYIQDQENGEIWSTTYHPVGNENRGYAVNLALDRAEIRRVDHDIEAHTRVLVAPEDDVEIRSLTLLNHSSRPRRLTLTTYLELALAPHLADRAHPAFSKLFIKTEADERRQILLAHRRPRDPDEPRIHVAQRLVGTGSSWSYETDRMRFIGRGRSLSNPVGASARLSNSAGFVLDPVFGQQLELSLEPGQRSEITLLLAAAEESEATVAMLDKYSAPASVQRARELAWTHAQLELRILGIGPDDARQFQKLASFLLYPGSRFRPPPERLAENTKGQAGLWPYGISGDHPIILVEVGDLRETGLVRELLQGHNYLRRHGLMADVVILNEEAISYDGKLTEQLERLVQAHTTFTGIGQPGGVYLLHADQIPQSDRALFMATARASLSASRGSLAQQLAGSPPEPDLPEQIKPGKPAAASAAALEPIQLTQANGFGGFTPGGQEYIIQLEPETETPAPWSNVIANPDFGCLLTEGGSGFAWAGNSQRYRLTGWSNDPVCDPASGAIYIRDERSGEYWSPTPRPRGAGQPYRVRHGTGYSVYEHNSHGIHQELLIFVPVDDQGGMPVRVQRLRLRNDGSEARKLSITFYVEWVLGEHREDTQMHVVTRWDSEAQTLQARNAYHPDWGQRTAFLATGPASEDYTADRTLFLGRNQHLQTPAALSRVELSRQSGAGLDPCGAIRVQLELDPGELGEVVGLLGAVDDPSAIHQIVRRFREADVVEQSFQETVAWWDRQSAAMQIETPEPQLDLIVNRWLLYQVLSCRLWARSGFYQSGGAYGFRDQLQDVMGLVYSAPRFARQQILRAASRQFLEGDVQHWWHPPGGAGVRTRIADDLLWLPLAVSHYVEVTGDQGILQELVGFLTAPTLDEDQSEAFIEPQLAGERASLYEHCRRAIERGLQFGSHGLPLMGAGDWNDGMNRVGAQGRGESVWLAWFLVEVLRRFAALAERHGRSEQAEAYREQGEQLIRRIEEHAWDGEWYLRAFHDDGSAMGSKLNQEAMIDALPQAWAAIAGGGDEERARVALEAAWERLVKEDDGLSLLFTPPFDGAGPDPGYIAGYPPGVRENGGQYTHAAIWNAIAWARLGDGERAVRLLQMLNPLRRGKDALHYQVEPYVVAADIYNLEGQVGRGGWTWYTGSAAWMYRAVIEEVFGLKIRGAVLQIDPVIPPAWERAEIHYRHGEAMYAIGIDNPDGVSSGVQWIELDGQRREASEIPLERGTGSHTVTVRLGN